MEGGPGRKRQWNEDLAATHGITPASTVSLPPIRQHALLSGHRKDHDTRALPPLLTSNEPEPFRVLRQQNSPLSPSSSPRPEAFLRHSSGRHLPYDNSLHPKKPKLHIAHESTLLPARPQHEHAQTAGFMRPNEKMACCGPRCKGDICLKTRSILQGLATELLLLDSHLTTALGPASSAATQKPEIDSTDFDRIASWALDVVRCNNNNIQEKTSASMKRSPDQVSVRTSVDVLDEVKRHPARSDFSSPERNPSKYERSPLPPSSRPLPSSAEPQIVSRSGTVANTPTHATSHSPPLVSQAQRMLPSPTSLNFPALQAPSFASSAGGAPTAAQAVHIQDLQRELSVKTLEYQSLRQEYDRLLQKLERERIRCATFENKAAVGEIEMNSAVTERDQVQAQVALLEVEIEKLQESRDEERRKSAASGSQYMKMVALSNQIQARNAEEKARWLVEKQTMERRLEGQSPDAPNTLVSPVLQPYNMSQDPDAHNEPLEQRKGHSDSEHKFGRYRHLSQENTRLNSRVSALEQALRSVRSESRAVHAALQSIAASSGANRELIDSLLDDG